jgi:diguanylate cyclase (GGDEF)-like protein/hemerythrin-like metal-binding protein/PAS domain S-box-containing protein
MFEKDRFLHDVPTFAPSRFWHACATGWRQAQRVRVDHTPDGAVGPRQCYRCGIRDELGIFRPGPLMLDQPMFEIFPWNKHLETGIVQIDEQHRVLVRLINRLAQQQAQRASELDLTATLGELTDYAEIHFRTEEGIWQSALAGQNLLVEHMHEHQRFVDHVVRLQAAHPPFQPIQDELFAYLTQWLTLHILGHDKQLAQVVIGLKTGLSLEAAQASAQLPMREATPVLLEGVLAMYRSLAGQAQELMQEKVARQQLEGVVTSSQQRWQFLLHGPSEKAAAGMSPVEQTLRSVIDNAPTGLVVADILTRRFVFANPWFCQLLGYPLDELLSMGPADIYPAEVMADIEEDFAHMLLGQTRATRVIATRRKDGSSFMAQVERLPMTLAGRASALAIFTDVTDRYRAEQALKASEAHLQTLVDTLPDQVWLKDAAGVHLSCNTAFERFLGQPKAAIIGKTDHELFSKEIADTFQANDRTVIASLRPLVYEECVNHPVTGLRTLMETTKVPLHDANGKLHGVLGVAHDITERQAAAAALEAERLQLQNAVDAAQAGTWEWDLRTDVIRFSERSSTMLGYPGLKLRQGPYDLYVSWIHPDDKPRQQRLMAQHLRGEAPSYELELRMRHKEGHWVWCRMLGRVMQRDANDQPVLVSGITIDISEQKSHLAQIDYLTHHDALTGLPNRKLFVELLDDSMRNNAAQQQLAVAYIDLDNFAAINLAYGPQVGNQLIVALSQRLSSSLQHQQGQHLLAHIGGDEFALMLGHLEQAGDCIAVVEKLLATLAQPLHVAEQVETLSLTASIGIAQQSPGDQIDAEQLLRQASQAMYLAKQAGKNRYHHFDPVKDEITRTRLTRIDEVGQALLRHEFVLFYQPKVRLRTGEVVGFEALIRWQHPELGLLPPYAFIGLLEQHPMAVKLGDWVIETALAQLASWQAQGINTTVSVNIDAQQLLDPDFGQRLLSQLGQQPTLKPQQLELEILETGALGNIPQVSALIAQLQSMGLNCALDDFGTGYSSLTFLKQLTARTLKIDQSFVRGMLDDVEDAAIVNSVLGLARNFDRIALAEGIETVAHGCALIEFGCEFGQGYAIAKPMPAAQVPDWLAQWRVPSSWAASESVGSRGIAMLLAETEHRAWFKEVMALATHSLRQPPVMEGSCCRFAVWLNKPSTRLKLEKYPGFARLEALHQTLHEHSDALFNQRAERSDAQTAQALAQMTDLSQQLVRELRALRQLHKMSPDTGESSFTFRT